MIPTRHSYNTRRSSSRGLSNGPNTVVLVAKEGYEDPPGLTYPPYHSPGAREVTINGDTRFDIELVRR